MAVALMGHVVVLSFDRELIGHHLVEAHRPLHLHGHMVLVLGDGTG